MKKLIWEIPLKTKDETNSFEHYSVKSKRHKRQQFFIKQLFMHEAEEIRLPCTVKFIRLSPGFMDEEDNLRMAFKWIKDQVGACLFPNKSVIYVTRKGQIKENRGHADSDKRVTWEYGQEKSRILGVRIEITFSDLDQPIDTVCAENRPLSWDSPKPSYPHQPTASLCSDTLKR